MLRVMNYTRVGATGGGGAAAAAAAAAAITSPPLKVSIAIARYGRT